MKRIQQLLLAFCLLFLPQLCLAQTVCNYVPGGCTTVSIGTGIIPVFAEILVYTGAGLCVLFVAWGGISMIASYGDESRFTQGRNSVMYAMIGFLVLLLAETIVGMVAARAPAAAAANPIVAAMTLGVSILLELLTIVFVVIIILAGFRLVIARGQQEQNDAARKAVIYAIIGAVVVNLAKVITDMVRVFLA